MEVVLCLLARQIPAMNPSQSARVANEQLQRQARNGLFKLSEDNSLLVAIAIQSMSDLTKLCSPTGAVSILPTMLYLTTGVIKEVATKSANDETIIANSSVIQAALQLLKLLATNRYSKHEASCDEWRKLLQSALGKIIDLTRDGLGRDHAGQRSAMMLAIAVFLLHTPSALVSVPDHAVSVHPTASAGLPEPGRRWCGSSIQMLTLLVPILINYLLEPDQFRTRPKQLESAIKRNQASSQMQAKNKSEAAARASVKEQQKPTIQLKTDFSNFGTTT
ncbi:hypothetical protein quinque_000020, partial [Culex quinquefasciatus]